MVGTKARWYAPTAPARADPPVRGKPIYPGLLDGDKKRKGREKRRERQPQRKPGGAPSYKPYDYPPRPVRTPAPERAPRPVMPTSPRPAKRMPGLKIGRAFAAYGLIEWLDPANWAKNPLASPILPGNWEWCKGPVSPIIPPPNFVWSAKAPFFTLGSCSGYVPLWGQAPTVNPPAIPGVFQGASGQVYWIRQYDHVTGGYSRDVVQGAMRRLSNRYSPVVPRPGVSPLPATPDPNIVRWMPPDTLYQPGDPVSEPAPFTRGVGTALAPQGFANPDLSYQPDYQWIWSPGIGLVDLVTPSVSGPTAPGGQGARPPRPPRPPRPSIDPVQREPPREREKQRKVVTKTAAIGIALFRALDRISESAEIVDAIYDALPDDVKKRWKQPGKPGDNFGQYGIDGADWKLRALYYNWHKVDVEQAIKNIIKNELQDQTIGRIQAGLPVNTGQAFSQGEREFAQLLDEWFAAEFGL